MTLLPLDACPAISDDAAPWTDQTSDPTPTEQAFTIAEAAERLGLTSEAVRMRLKRGTLAGLKIEGHWVVYLPKPTEQNRSTDPTATKQPTEQAPKRDQTPTKQDQAKPDANRHTETPAIVGQLIAAKDETIDALRSEVEFLRRELESRTDELERRDVLLREALGRIPQLPTGEPRSDPHMTHSEVQGEEIAVNDGSDTSRSVAWSWWRRLRGRR